MNMHTCYCMWLKTRGPRDDMNMTLFKYVIGSNLGQYCFLIKKKKVPFMMFLLSKLSSSLIFFFFCILFCSIIILVRFRDCFSS
jgi:hypothetical protein